MFLRFTVFWSFYVQFCIEFTLYVLRSTLYVLPSTFYSLHSTSYSLQSVPYALRSTIYPLSPSTLYVLPATLFDPCSTFYQVPLFNLRSAIYHLTSKPIYTLHSISHPPQSTLYPLSPSAWKVIGIFKFFFKFLNFLMKISEQHKGRLLVVVSFFVYFQHASSLSETSSRNDLSVPKFNFPWKWITAETCC